MSDETPAEQRIRELVENARRDALAAFRRIPALGVVYECLGCSALVIDPEKHLDWHGTLRDGFGPGQHFWAAIGSEVERAGPTTSEGG